MEEHHEAPDDSPELRPEEGYEATPEVKVEGLAVEAVETSGETHESAETPEAIEAIDPTSEAKLPEPAEPVEPAESAQAEAKLPVDPGPTAKTADFQARARVHQAGETGLQQQLHLEASGLGLESRLENMEVSWNRGAPFF